MFIGLCERESVCLFVCVFWCVCVLSVCVSVCCMLIVSVGSGY